jgi:chemotaxis protein CheD
MNRIIDVHTGEVKAGGKDMILKSNAIGSCVVIAAYDSTKKVGALAHVMLPGAVPEGKTFQRTRYAADAIEEMISRMTHLAANKDGIEVCLVGGGNVLKRKDDTISQQNIASVVELLNEKRIKIGAKAVGGTERRTVSLDVKKGTIHYTEGDAKENLLWKAAKENYASAVKMIRNFV